jgi:UPF0755 protein
MRFNYRINKFWFSVRRLIRHRLSIIGAIVFGVIFLLYVLFISAPFDFPTGAYVDIKSGSSLSQSATLLESKHVVRSSLLLKILVYLVGGKHVVAGEYFFPSPANIFAVASRLGKGEFLVDPAKVRVPEGATLQDIAKLLASNIPNFDMVAFMGAARGKEGYLFPDTYFFMPGEGTAAILGAFENNFSTHIAKIQNQISAFGKPLSDVVVMASLLEREAPDTSDRRIISGILWKRIKLGMPLQVDAVFPYFLGKNSFTLTRSDLKSENPYNTYTHLGLPPGAIANPSIDAILASVTPVETNYLYYLSDRLGNIHYSATYEQHLAYKDKYLRN